MEAQPEGSPIRVGHGIASPKGAAKKEVHTSITGSLDEPSCTANRVVTGPAELLFVPDHERTAFLFAINWIGPGVWYLPGQNT